MRRVTLLLFLSACNPSDEITDPGTKPGDDTDDSAVAACEGDETCEAWEICEDGSCVDGDRDNSSSEATPIAWDEDTTGYLNPREDIDYFVISAEGGEFARVSTRPTGGEEGEPEASGDMDTVILIYDAAGGLVSWEDDYPTGSSVSGYDSIAYTYFAQAGDYVIVVMDASTAYDREDKLGGPDFSYVVNVQAYAGAPDEPDSFASPGAEREVEEGYLYPVAVLLEESGDSDWIELDLPYGDCPVLLRGSANLDGTDAQPRVRLWTGGEELLLDLDSLGSNGVALYPSVDGGKVVIEALDAQGGGGDNHWFYVIASVYEQGYSTTVGGSDVPYQIDAEPNDALEEAQLLEQRDFTTDGGSTYTGAFLWGTQDGPGDEDWYAFHAEAGWFLNAWGTADYNGSLMDPAIEVYDAAGQLVTSWYDGSDDAPDLNNLEVQTTGTHYLRVFDETGEAEGGAPYFYRFSLYVTDFEVE